LKSIKKAQFKVEGWNESFYDCEVRDVGEFDERYTEKEPFYAWSACKFVYS